jgi:hypothetical protein
MKPLFLDCPPRYTRTQREQVNDVDHACAIHGTKRNTDYGRVWWIAMILIMLATGWAVTL